MESKLMKKMLSIIMLMLVSPTLYSQTGDSDFFRVYSGETQATSCKKKYEILNSINQNLKEDEEFRKLEVDIDQKKADLAIINGLRNINKAMMKTLDAVTPYGRSVFANHARDLETLQLKTENAVSDYARFKTMEQLLGGLNELFYKNPPILSPSLDENVRASTLYHMLKGHHDRSEEKNPFLTKLFSTTGNEVKDLQQLALVKSFLNTFAKSVYSKEGVPIEPEAMRSNLKRYQDELFRNVPIDSREFISQQDIDSLDSRAPYQAYRSCLENVAPKSNEPLKACEDQKKAYTDVIENINTRFSAIKNNMGLNPSDLRKYDSLSLDKFNHNIDGMMRNANNDIFYAKQDLTRRLHNIQRFKDTKSQFVRYQERANQDHTSEFYNNIVNKLMCEPNKPCIGDKKLINPDFSINDNALDDLLKNSQDKKLVERQIDEYRKNLEAEIKTQESKLAELKNQPRIKAQLTAMDLLADYLVKNCKGSSGNSDFQVVSCGTSELGPIRILTSPAKSLAADVASVIGLRSTDQSSLATLNTTCAQMTKEEREKVKLEEVCQSAFAEYWRIVESNKASKEAQEFMDTHRIRPNADGDVFCKNEKTGKEELCEGATAEPSSPGYGKAVTEVFAQHMVGDNLLPGWMQIGVTHFTLDNQLDLAYSYGIQEKTYLSWQTQYWQNIQNQCMFAVGMCVPTTPMTGGPMFNFTP